MDSYSTKLILFTLRHYADIASGVSPIEAAANEGLVKSAGRKNPMETFLVWRSDIDRGISSLAGANDKWAKYVLERDLEYIRFKAFDLLPVQRHLVLHHIFEGDCEGCSAIKRIKCFLNGEEYVPKSGPNPGPRAKSGRGGYITIQNSP